MNLKQQIVNRALELWAENIRDTDDGYPGDRERITEMWDACGWRPWVQERSDDGLYQEIYHTKEGKRRTMKWCGIFVGYVCRTIETPIEKKIADKAFPSTLRLANPEKWTQAPIYVDPVAVEPGDIATVGEGRAGTHIVLIVSAPSSGYVTTIEGNARGQLGNGESGEGVVKKRRRVSEIRKAYRLTPEMFSAEKPKQKPKPKKTSKKSGSAAGARSGCVCRKRRNRLGDGPNHDDQLAKMATGPQPRLSSLLSL